MTVNYVAIVDQAQAIFKHRVVLGGKTSNNIGANRNFGTDRLHLCNQLNRKFSAVAAFHPFQDHIVARLQ